MAAYRCEWDLDDDVDGNVQHIAEHGLTKEDVEHALECGCEPEPSRSSSRPLMYGPSLDGTEIVVVFEQIDPKSDPTWIYVVTAYTAEN
jgi:hypothetical protein